MAENDQQKRSARKAITRAIAWGRLTPGSCEVCGAVKVDAHHDDYARPLDVRWLCRRHHADLHKALRARDPSKGRGRTPRVHPPPTAGTLDAETSLVRTQAEFEEAAALRHELQEARNAAVRAAIAEGWTHARIAEATGLTRSRVGQIALGHVKATAGEKS